MRTEIDEALDFYEWMSGTKPDINASWTSIHHINWRRAVLTYRQVKKQYGITFYDSIGNKKMIKRYKL
jgi:hypothetical protein